MFDEFFTKAHELTQRGEPFATATVVRAEKPTSGKPGDKAIITADGALHGWIGGSCAQPTVIREAQRALRDGASRLIRLSTDPASQPPREGLLDVAMTCFSGGTLEIYIEPQQPRPRLLIVGQLPLARALAQLAKAMSYHVIIADVEASGASPPPYADALISDLSALAVQITAQTYVVVATHGQFDELALEQALAADPPYVGLVASRRRAESVREYLATQGVPAERLARLVAPAGLDLRARRGDEIALSIMAEIVQRRNTRQTLAIDDQAPSMAIPRAEAAPLIAIDPVCQMEVAIVTALHTHAHAGTTYYFCCPGCKGRFAKHPERYLVAQA
jgi:xanthine dehydrogenase accessory factor